MRAEVGAFHGFLADLGQFLTFPSVAAKDRHGQPDLFRLNTDQRRVRVVARHEDAFGIRTLDRGELAFEILVAAIEIQLLHDLPAACEECLFEELREAFRIVALHIGKNRNFLSLECLFCEIRHHRSLKRINETDAENIIAGLRYFRIRGGRRDLRDAFFLANRGGFERAAGGDFAEDGDGPVFGDELVDGVRGFTGLRLVVLGREFDLFPEHAARRIQFLHGEFRAFVRGDAEGGFLAGERGKFAD